MIHKCLLHALKLCIIRHTVKCGINETIAESFLVLFNFFLIIFLFFVYFSFFDCILFIA